MPTHDEAHQMTDLYLSDIEKRLRKEYGKAAQDVQRKLDDYLRRFRIKDEIWRKRLAAGEVTAADYQQWRHGQIMIGKRWEDMRDTLAQDLRNADKIARSIVDGYRPEVYALNHNYATFLIERDSLVDTSYSLYSREAVEYLMRDDPDLLPPPSKRVSAAIAEGRAIRWERQQVQSVMLQGILQGKGIPELARDVSRDLATRNLGDAVRYARTAMTGAENKGRLDAYHRAQSHGVQLQKTWLAALDNRTRHEHRMLDGQTVDTDKPFRNAYGEIMYPGDPSARPANVWNCRCTLISQLRGFETDVKDLSLRNTDKLNGMTYEEWLQAKPVYNPIKAPIEKQNAIKGAYIQEYKDARRRLG